MLKKYISKKILIVIFSSIVLLLVYIFPTNKSTIESELVYSNIDIMPIYLLDNYNYVSRIEVVKTSTNLDEEIKEIIYNLTIGNDTNTSNKFKKVIPKGTTLINYSLTDKILKINFSKEFLNIDKDNENALFEALIYSLTELKEVDKIIIYIEGELLTKMPISNNILPNTLDRSFGINKVYLGNKLTNSTKVTTYYASKDEDNYYYIPITSIENNNKEKIEIIIEKLKTSPTYNVNLISYLEYDTKLLNYEILENSVNLSFNNSILNLDTNSIVETVKYSIALSIRDTYNIDETIFYVDGTLIDASFM